MPENRDSDVGFSQKNEGEVLMIKLEHLDANYYLLIWEYGYNRQQILLSREGVLELKNAIEVGL